MFSQPQYSYSLQTIDFIIEEIKKDPENIIQNLKTKLKKISQPQGQRNSKRNRLLPFGNPALILHELTYL